MNINEFERQVLMTAEQWSFLRSIDTIDKTDYAVKLRLHVDAECFIQVYANVEKNIVSYALVLNRSRIYGRDNEGGKCIGTRMINRIATTVLRKA